MAKALLIVIALAVLLAVAIAILNKNRGGVVYHVTESINNSVWDETDFETALARMAWTTKPPYLHFTFSRTGTESDYTADIVELSSIDFELDIDGVVTQWENGELCKEEIRKRDRQL